MRSTSTCGCGKTKREELLGYVSTMAIAVAMKRLSRSRFYSLISNESNLSGAHAFQCLTLFIYSNSHGSAAPQFRADKFPVPRAAPSGSAVSFAACPTREHAPCREEVVQRSCRDSVREVSLRARAEAQSVGEVVREVVQRSGRHGDGSVPIRHQLVRVRGRGRARVRVRARVRFN